MKTAVYALSLLLAATIVRAQGAGQDATGRGTEGRRDVFANRWQVSKGGLGMINNHLYIVVKSAENELMLDSAQGKERRWKGKSGTQSEVVLVYQGEVWSSNELPVGFDLSKAVIVSFEGPKIRFLDFESMSGGYYERLGQ